MLFGQLVLAFALQWGAVRSLPSYQQRVPNGNRVPCPAGAEGCTRGDPMLSQPDSVCSGLGHRTCAGGSLPANPFGYALEASGFKWTPELCAADSDGDGRTNGEELGDPCCSWRPGDAPSAYMRAWRPTHPGVATDVPKAYTKPACGQDTTPPWRGPRLASFNDGEEQRHEEWQIKNYAVPKQRTVYQDFIFNFRDTTSTIFHIVSAEAIVKSPRNLHHYVIYGCSQRVPDDQEGMPLLGKLGDGCSQVPIGFWAPGGEPWDLPAYAGFPIGQAVGVVAFRLNVHYTDAEKVSGGLVSVDGLRIHYTPTLRPSTFLLFSVMQVGMNPTMWVPPNRSRYFVTRTCKLTACEDIDSDSLRYALARQGNGLSLECSTAASLCNARPILQQLCPRTCGTCPKVSGPASVPALGAFFHAHLVSAGMTQTLTRNGVTIDLGSQTGWSYDDQAWFWLFDRNLTLQEGDVVQSTCFYNTRSRSTMTALGQETIDEMCFALVGIVVPSTNTSSVVVPPLSCSGSIWAGEMGPTDLGSAVQQLYPLEQAADVWSAGLLGTSGYRSYNERLLSPVASTVIQSFDKDGDMLLTAPEATTALKQLGATLSEQSRNAMLGALLQMSMTNPNGVSSADLVKLSLSNQNFLDVLGRLYMASLEADFRARYAGGPSCPSDAVLFRSKCFVRVSSSTPFNMLEARRQCAAIRADGAPAAIESQQENDFVWRFSSLGLAYEQMSWILTPERKASALVSQPAGGSYANWRSATSPDPDKVVALTFQGDWVLQPANFTADRVVCSFKAPSSDSTSTARPAAGHPASSAAAAMVMAVALLWIDAV